MLHRRTATTLAATTALVLAGAAPALANHEVPEEVDGNPNCEAAVAAIPELASFDSPDLDSLLKDEDFGNSDLTTDINADDFSGFDIFVIVKGGPHANVYLEPPFHDLGSPDGEAISHIEVCGVPNGETPAPTKEPSPEPTNGKTTPPATEEPSPEPTEKDEAPAPVPTAVPAGHNGSASSVPFGTIGLFVAATALLAGAAALVRRRFVHGS